MLFINALGELFVNVPGPLFVNEFSMLFVNALSELFVNASGPLSVFGAPSPLPIKARIARVSTPAVPRSNLLSANLVI
jgi:hypothetical protein